MKKYIKSQRGSLTYEIERQDYSTKFRTPDNYFSHATRTVWYSTTGFNVFVQYKGTFYMIDRLDNGDEVATLEFDAITAEEAAAAKMERAAEAMDEAQKAEAKTTDAAIIYDAETAEAEARNARFAADYAAHLANMAHCLAAEAGTSNAASIADTASEYAERAREYARRATETADQSAAEAEQRAKADDAAARFCAALTEATGAAPIYQRYELETYLGEPEDYDVDAIEAEATRYTADGTQVWTASNDELANIAERHQLVTYWPAV